MNSTSSSNAWNFNTVFKAADALSVQDYKDAALLYQESRVVGLEVEFHPTYKYDHAPNGIDLTYATPLFLCPFYQDTTALSGDLNAFQHAGRKLGALNTIVKASIKATELASMDFYPTSSPSAGVYGIKTWISGITNGASTQVSGWGTFYVTYVVQFRRRTRTATAIDTKQSHPISPKSSVNIISPYPVDTKENKQQKIQKTADETSDNDNEFVIMRRAPPEPSPSKLLSKVTESLKPLSLSRK